MGRTSAGGTAGDGTLGMAGDGLGSLMMAQDSWGARGQLRIAEDRAGSWLGFACCGVTFCFA